jgi:hypothetical protein
MGEYDVSQLVSRTWFHLHGDIHVHVLETVSRTIGIATVSFGSGCFHDRFGRVFSFIFLFMCILNVLMTLCCCIGQV